MFNFETAFSRNIGWLTHQELRDLQSKKVAIAGAGGVGGEHLITLTRLGIGQFHIADFDEFEVHNFNRQAGAFLSTIGQKKLDVMHNMAKDINPELMINTFDEGINPSNIDSFLSGVDLYVDSLDFFAIDARQMVFNECVKRKIPIVTAAPIGMGCALLCFLPGQMSPEEYFRFDDAKSDIEKYIKFYIGLAPSALQTGYFVEPDAVDFKTQKVPSVPMGIKICAGIAGTYAVKILLDRGQKIAAPYGLHFDAYKNRLKKTWRPGGNRNPLQQLLFRYAKKTVLK